MKCAAPDCEKPVDANKLCHKHDQQQRCSADPQKFKKANRKYYLAHQQQINRRARRWHRAHVEQASVRAHHRNIFICKRRNVVHSYQGMPFHDGWNPDKGGSFDAGAEWIIANLGHKPSRNHLLHIVNRRIGFMPGNLQWVPRSQHAQEELVNKLLLENQSLKTKLRSYEDFWGARPARHGNSGAQDLRPRCAFHLAEKTRRQS